MSWTLDVDQERFEVKDAGDLRRLLLRLHGQAESQPLIALLNSPDGACLAIGLGRERSVLNFLAPGGWPAKHAIGDDASEGVVAYRLAGEVSEMPTRCSIPLNDAMDTAVQFFESGVLPQGLRWEDD